MAGRFKLHVLNGILLPDVVTQDALDSMKDFKLYSDDVWIVTYPKCGTTWVQQIVKLIRSNGVQDNVSINDSIPWLERRFDIGRSMPQPRAFKSHYSYDLFPSGLPSMTPCKYIYVARNPKDQVTSFYYHVAASIMPNIDKESYMEKYFSKELPFGDYFDHLLSWWPHRNDENILFLKYEDIKKNLLQAVSTIASFIQTNLSEVVVDKIADATTFEKMKENPFAMQSYFPPGFDQCGKDFMRKGKVGDWKNFLTPEQAARIDALCDEKLRNTGLEFEYE